MPIDAGALRAMAGRVSLNAKILEALGPARLAEQLLQRTAGNAATRRALWSALAEASGAAGNGAGGA